MQYTHKASLHWEEHTECYFRLCNKQSVYIYIMKYTICASQHFVIHKNCWPTLSNKHTVILCTVLYTKSSSQDCGIKSHCLPKFWSKHLVTHLTAHFSHNLPLCTVQKRQTLPYNLQYKQTPTQHCALPIQCQSKRGSTQKLTHKTAVQTQCISRVFSEHTVPFYTVKYPHSAPL